MEKQELTPHELEKVETLAKTFNGGIGNAVFAAAELMAEMRPLIVNQRDWGVREKLIRQDFVQHCEGHPFDSTLRGHPEGIAVLGALMQFRRDCFEIGKLKGENMALELLVGSANTYGGLHKSLDTLVATYVAETKKTLGGTTLMEFIQWSGEKMKQEVKGAASADDRPHHA